MTKERDLALLDAAVEPEGGHAVAGGGDERVPAIYPDGLSDAIRVATRDAVRLVLDDQSATFVVGGCVLDLHGLRRRQHLAFVADVVASRVADAVAGKGTR
jgi:hypothetical protein